MNPAEFKKKWSRSKAKETASDQEHFTDLCRLRGQPTPIEADPGGSDFFCYQKRVVKDADRFGLQPFLRGSAHLNGNSTEGGNAAKMDNAKSRLQFPPRTPIATNQALRNYLGNRSKKHRRKGLAPTASSW